MKMNEDQIVELALKSLKEQTGIKADWKSGLKEINGEVRFTLEKKSFRMYAQVKKELRPHHLDSIFVLAEKFRPFMIIAESIFPAWKEQLRKKKIGYLDVAGNIYIKAANNFICIEGNKPIIKRNTANRAFTKTGLRTVFYLLLHDSAINLPYRKLSELTGVALGNIKNVIDGLKTEDFIIRINEKTLKLQNKEALMERWLTGFRETLKPLLYLGSYTLWDKKKLANWQELKFDINETKWGGEPAAEILTNHLSATNLTLYTKQKNSLLKSLTLIPYEKGGVHLYEKFWNDEVQSENQCVPPLLIYADLMFTNDPRCQETAAIIFKKYLKNDFQ